MAARPNIKRKAEFYTCLAKDRIDVFRAHAEFLNMENKILYESFVRN
jgi:hypothetical protein